MGSLSFQIKIFEKSNGILDGFSFENIIRCNGLVEDLSLANANSSL